jgi:hypothetical protein
LAQLRGYSEWVHAVEVGESRASFLCADVIIFQIPSPQGSRQLPMTNPETTMSKGMDRKKEDRKKPSKTLKEKRTEKQAKRANRA